MPFEFLGVYLLSLLARPVWKTDHVRILVDFGELLSQQSLPYSDRRKPRWEEASHMSVNKVPSHFGSPAKFSPEKYFRFGDVKKLA